MLSVLLLDDDQWARKFLKKVIEEIPCISKVYDTSQGLETIKVANTVKPDMVILDVELSKESSPIQGVAPLNGLEVAKIIRESLPKTEIVFLTGYKDYAIDSFAVHPYDYIVKPVNPGRIAEVINGVFHELSHKNISKIMLKHNYETLFIRPEEVIFIEKEHRTTLIHTRDFVCPTNISLKEWEATLDARIFIRVHQSFLINSNEIEKIIDLGNRSYKILFKRYNRFAFMSRYKVDELNEKFYAFKK